MQFYLKLSVLLATFTTSLALPIPQSGLELQSRTDTGAVLISGPKDASISVHLTGPELQPRISTSVELDSSLKDLSLSVPKANLELNTRGLSDLPIVDDLLESTGLSDVLNELGLKREAKAEMERRETPDCGSSPFQTPCQKSRK